MSQRPSDTTKWVWCFLILSSGPIWSPVSTVTVRTPEDIPSAIEAQAKFFQDFFSVQLSPYKIEFGHVCEDPNRWEQRYERKDFKNHRDMGKVRWGDKKGGYGEHYWDLNHAGHTGNQGSDDYDDGSYHEDPQENYQESESQPIQYEMNSKKYKPDDTTLYEDNGRTKRAQTRRGQKKYEEKQKLEQRRLHKNAEKSKNDRDSVHNEGIDLEKTTLRGHIKRRVREQYNKETPTRRTKKHIADHNQKLRDNFEDTVNILGQKHFISYQDGIGPRQRSNYEVASASAPRLFLEPFTGHVIDTTTGQAYILHPVSPNNKYS